MTQQHPIIPPPELIKKWWVEAQEAADFDGLRCWVTYVATRAARWGADQELEACREWVRDNDGYDRSLALEEERRPEPSN